MPPTSQAVAELELLLSYKDTATQNIKRSLGDIDKQTKTSTNSISTLGKTIRSHWLAIAGAIAGVVAATRGISNAINAFAQYEKGLSNIKILLGDAKEDIVLFDNAVTDLSKKFGVNTQALLKSGFDIQSAVGNISQSIDILNAATKLSVAGGAELVDTTKGLVTLMESYGDQLNGAADAADLLFIAQVRARATIAELSSASGMFIPLAAKLNAGAEETFAVFSKMTVALGDVNLAATSLNAILNLLLKPTDSLKAKSQEWWGISVQQAVAQKGLLEVLQKLSTVEKEELGTMLGRRQAVRGLVSVAADLNTVQKQAIEFTNRSGQTTEALNTQMETVEVRLARTTEKWHEMNRTIGEFLSLETPLLSWVDNITNAITTALPGLANLKNIFSPAAGGIAGLAGTTELEPLFTDEDKAALDKAFNPPVPAASGEEEGGGEEGGGTKTDLFAKLKKDAKDALEKVSDMSEEVSEFVTGTIDTFSSGFGSAFADMIMIGKDFGKSMQEIFTEWAAMAIQQITAIITKMLILKSLKFVFGGQGGFLADFFHEGGAIMHAGGPVVPKMALPIIAHKGLAVDEVPVIAQTGEGFLSRRGMAALGGVPELNRLNRGQGRNTGGVTVYIENASFNREEDIQDVLSRLSDLIEVKQRSRI